MRKVYFMRLFESICMVGNHFFTFQSVILKYLLIYTLLDKKNNIKILPFNNTNIIFDLDEYIFHLITSTMLMSQLFKEYSPDQNNTDKYYYYFI